MATFGDDDDAAAATVAAATIGFGWLVILIDVVFGVKHYLFVCL